MPDLFPKADDQFKPGDDQISAEALNKITRAVLRQIKGGGDSSVDYYGDRAIIRSSSIQPQLPASDNYMAQFVVLEEAEDMLLCTPFLQPSTAGIWHSQVYDPTLGIGSLRQFYVAKPYALQQTPWNGRTVDGVTYTYTGIGERDAGSTPQTISSPYVAGDIIVAIQCISGYYDTNLKVPVIWQDINAAARSWMFSGNAAYDISGTYPDQIRVTGIQDVSVLDSAPAPQQVLTGARLTSPIIDTVLLASGGALPAGVAQHYVISAFNRTGETLPSTEGSATPAGGNLSVALTWIRTVGAAGYKIYRSTTPGTYNDPCLLVTITDGAADTFTDAGLSLSAGAPADSNTTIQWRPQTPPAPSNSITVTDTYVGTIWSLTSTFGVSSAIQGDTGSGFTAQSVMQLTSPSFGTVTMTFLAADYNQAGFLTCEGTNQRIGGFKDFTRGMNVFAEVSIYQTNIQGDTAATPHLIISGNGSTITIYPDTDGVNFLSHSVGSPSGSGLSMNLLMAGTTISDNFFGFSSNTDPGPVLAILSFGSWRKGLTGTLAPGASATGGVVTNLGSGAYVSGVSGGATGLVFTGTAPAVMSGVLNASNSAGASYPTTNVGGATVSAGMCVATHSSGVGIVLANASDNSLNCVGLATADISSSSSGTIQTTGTITLSDWTAATGSSTLAPKAVYFLDVTNGLLTTTPPSTLGQIVQSIGRSVSPTALELDIQPSVIL